MGNVDTVIYIFSPGWFGNTHGDCGGSKWGLISENSGGNAPWAAALSETQQTSNWCTYLKCSQTNSQKLELKELKSWK